MSRLAWILMALVSVLLVVLWWFLMWSPTSEEIDQVRADTEVAQNQTAQQRAEEARRRQIRETAPEVEAELSAGQVLIPSDPALPALLRQMQQATDDAGVRLLSIAPGRPAEIGEAPGGLASMQVALNVTGTYFQLIDLARRLEDPALTGRGLVWNSVAISPGEYPELTVSLSAQVFTRVPIPEAAVEQPTEDADTDGVETVDDGLEDDGLDDPESDPVGDLDEDVVIQ